MVTSPDSIPSLAEVSQASIEADDIARGLFPSPEREDTEVAIRYSQNQSGGEDSVFEFDNSIASEVDSALENFQTNSSLLLPESQRSDVDALGTPEIDTVAGACHSAMTTLSPKKLAAMFNIFDSSHRSDSSVNDAVTEVTSNIDQSVVSWERKVDSLERDCATLKDIIKVDSATILRLKTELSEFHDAESLLHSKPNNKGFPLDGSNTRGLDILTERETQHIETIEVQKGELDNSYAAMNTYTATKEIERLRLENALFASQIVENEIELTVARTNAKQLEEESRKLMYELEILRVQAAQTSLVKERQPERELIYDLSDHPQIVSLATRISEIEHGLEFRNQWWYEDDRRETVSDFDPSCPHPPANEYGIEVSLTENDLEPSHPHLPADEYGIEVALTEKGVIITSCTISEAHENDISSPKKDPESIEQGGIFCDCCRVASTKEDN